jgi:hypothetical protein
MGEIDILIGRRWSDLAGMTKLPCLEAAGAIDIVIGAWGMGVTGSYIIHCGMRNSILKYEATIFT